MLSDERSAILENLLSVASRLHNNVPQNLVPPDGVQLAYARKDARDEGGIACVRGGLCMKNTNYDLLSAGFGDGGMIATVLLTAMKFDPLIRSAGIIACTPTAVKMMEVRFLEICSFDPRNEPPGIRTMDWGVAQCCRDGVPDAISSRRTGDAGAIIRLFGEDPQGIANNILMLSV
jgi:thiamine-phosphate diphosphorylase